MKLLPSVRVLAVAFMSCALGACVSAEVGEADSDEAAVSAEETVPEVAPESLAPPGGGESNAVACDGTGNWCLAECSKTGDHLNIVGTRGQVGGCVTSGETFCTSHKLGYRTHSCWGHL